MVFILNKLGVALYSLVYYIGCMKSNLFSLLLLGFIACSSPTGETIKNSSSDITEAEKQLRDIWVLTWMDGFAVDSATFPNQLATLELNPSDSTVMGTTGCNRLNGSIFASKDGAITFDEIGTTRMYCDAVPEAAFLDYLTKTNQYKRDGLTLWLLADGKKLLGFKKVD
jgi:heat shock protein HslJ